MSSQRGYKVRYYINGATKDGKEFKAYSITVPPEIGEQIPEGVRFTPRITDEGILYEPIDQSKDKQKLPAWAKRPKPPLNGDGK